MSQKTYHTGPGPLAGQSFALATGGGPLGAMGTASGPELGTPSALQHAVWRLFDILIATAILVLIAPFLLLLTVLLFLNDPGPVFYAHRRVGYRGRFFPCLKFRTMRTDGDEILQRYLAENPAARRELAVTCKLRDDPRVTAVGAILRKFSLDEFPQLFNVLAGQMSIVGPRPVVLSEVERYGRQFEVYCRVRPGLTGLWQISGRSDVSYATRVRMDIDYVCRKGLALDLWLLVRTIPAVACSRGAY